MYAIGIHSGGSNTKQSVIKKKKLGVNLKRVQPSCDQWMSDQR